MKGIATLSVLALTAPGALSASVQPEKRSVQAVTVKGNAFYQGGSRFYIRGIDYQPGGSSKVADPIADVSGCKRDITEFKKLGINTVRVYTVDNTADHDECMNALADAGIYLVLDVNTPKYSLNRAQPKASYNDVYLQNIFATIDVFQKYSNTLAFFSGNEVINDDKSTQAAPWVKAVTRDMRQYIGNRGYRKIPVGYSAADVSSNRKEMADYMNCGTDDERSDFFAFNDYSWCDPSSFTTSGWDQKVATFKNYGIPLFLSEYGCITNGRQFQEVSALYSSEMTGVFSGGLVYEYSEEGSGYGLVEINGDSVREQKDFTALKNAFAKQQSPSGMGGASTGGVASKCPPESSSWKVSTDSLPAIPEPAKKYMTSGAGKGAGLSGSGSQNAGTGSSGTASAGSGQPTKTGTSSGAASTGTTKSAAVALGAPSYAGFLVCTFSIAASALFGVALL